jgi:hypothetical protein
MPVDKEIVKKFNEIEQAQYPNLDLTGSERFCRSFWEEEALTKLVQFYVAEAKVKLIKEIKKEIKEEFGWHIEPEGRIDDNCKLCRIERAIGKVKL